MKNAVLVLIIFASALMLSGCSYGKYEGVTAEEWADEYYDTEENYRKFRSCVEDYDSLSFEEKDQYGGVFYYCE